MSRELGYTFYCQLAYGHVAYPSPTSPNGNLADNGCGPCAAAMVAENLAGVAFPPEAAAKLAKACGAREGFGTNLFLFAPAFAGHVGLTLTVTEDPDEARAFLEAGRGMAIANTQGDREGYTGVFSNGGHYVVAVKLEGGKVCVLDPMYSPTLNPDRYEIPGRRGKVRLDGCCAWADWQVLAEDCRDRSWFLFEKSL